MSGNSKRENREVPAASEPRGAERSANVSDGTADVNVAGKSDGSVVPAKSMNKAATEAAAESMEERDPAKGNAGQANSRRTPSRIKRESRGLHGVREAARRPFSRPTQGRSRMRSSFTYGSERGAAGNGGP